MRTAAEPRHSAQFDVLQSTALLPTVHTRSAEQTALPLGLRAPAGARRLFGEHAKRASESHRANVAYVGNVYLQNGGKRGRFDLVGSQVGE